MGTRYLNMLASVVVTVGLLSGAASANSADEEIVRSVRWGVRGALNTAIIDNAPVTYSQNAPASLHNTDLFGIGGDIGVVANRWVSKEIFIGTGLRFAPMYYISEETDSLPEFNIKEYKLAVPFFVQFNFTEMARDCFFQFGFIEGTTLSSKPSNKNIELDKSLPEKFVYNSAGLIAAGWHINPQLALFVEIVLPFSGGINSNAGLTYFVNSHTGK